MPGIEISALPAAPAALLTDVFPVDQLPGPVTYKESNSQLLTLFKSNGEALTRTNDTNVTATLSGSPATALLNATLITLGWTGQLAPSRGGSGLASLTAYTLLAGGTTPTGNFQQVSAGSAGQLLQSNGASALPTWTTATFPPGSGTLNHMLRSDGTNWVQTTATVLDASDNLSGLTSLTAGNINLLGNTISSTDTNGNISLIPNGSGVSLVGSTVSYANSSPLAYLQVAANGLQSTISAGAYKNNTGGAFFSIVKSRSTTIGSRATVSSGDTIGAFDFYADDGTNLINVASMGCQVTASTSTGIVPTNLSFSTMNTSGANLTALTISNAQIVSLAHALAETSGGTGQSTYTLGDTLYSSAANTLSKLAGNITTTKQYLSQTGTGAVSAAPVWATITGADITGAALTKADDTNVTATLTGSPTTALLRATLITLGWTGQLSLARGGSNASLVASNGGIIYSDASAMAVLAGTATAGQMLRSGTSAAPSWSTATWPATTTINQILYSSSANTVVGLATANSSVLVTSSGGVPSLSTALPSGLTATNMSLTTPTLGVASATSINFGGGALSNYVPPTSFPPVVTFGGLSTGITYTTQLGTYVRVGDVVTFVIQIVLSSKGSATGSLNITGFPIAGRSGLTQVFGVSSENLTYATSPIQASLGSGASLVILYRMVSTTTVTIFTDAACTNTTTFFITGSYIV